MKKSGKLILHLVRLSLSTGMYVLWILVAGCAERRTAMSDAEAQQYLALGDSIASHAQMVLLSNVSGAIAREGVDGALAYCSEEAMGLTDSLALIFGVDLQRLSDRNRNPNNSLQTIQDRESWRMLRELLSDDKAEKKHLLNQENNQLVYYKAIPLAMATCLKCHGEPGLEIEASTLSLLKEKYQEDSATGYLLGQLRGMWKIKLADLGEDH